MNIDFESIEEAWNDAEAVVALNEGDHFITRETSMLYYVGVSDMYEEVSDNSVRRLKKAQVTVSSEAFGIIAEYVNDPDYGRFMFKRTFWDDNVWVSEEGQECTIDELVNIRVIMDEGVLL